MSEFLIARPITDEGDPDDSRDVIYYNVLAACFALQESMDSRIPGTVQHATDNRQKVVVHLNDGKHGGYYEVTRDY